VGANGCSVLSKVALCLQDFTSHFPFAKAMPSWSAFKWPWQFSYVKPWRIVHTFPTVLISQSAPTRKAMRTNQSRKTVNTIAFWSPTRAHVFLCMHYTKSLHFFVHFMRNHDDIFSSFSGIFVAFPGLSITCFSYRFLGIIDPPEAFSAPQNAQFCS
jgi:hypothetical protein